MTRDVTGSLDPTAARQRLRCNVRQIDDILGDCLREAEAVMSPAGIDAWLDGATRVCGLGRGTELVLIYLEGLPAVVAVTGAEALVAEAADMAAFLSRGLVSEAINPFLSTLPTVARRLENADSVRQWFRLVERVAGEAGEGLPALFQSVPRLLTQLGIGGLANWIGFGLRAYREQTWRAADFFGLRTADAHAALHRERHGTLLIDNERTLDLTLRALWTLDEVLRPHAAPAGDGTGDGEGRDRPFTPYLDKLGFHLPDVLDDGNGVTGLDRYRAMVAHLAAHRTWSRPYVADNYSPFQHLAIEVFEDSRVDALAMRPYPGLRRLWMALHPVPVVGACPPGWSSIRHRMAMLSRALLDPDHPYTDPVILKYVGLFHERLRADPLDPMLSPSLGVAFLTEVRTPDFNRPKVWFVDTIVSYRDDNRYLWRFLEATDDEDDFHSDHGTEDLPEEEEEEDGDAGGLMPPQHYPEWDRAGETYRPDWATVYEAWPPSGRAADIDAVLDRHRGLARQIRHLVDRLKPQQRRRIRHQREGDDLDLDQTIGAMIDLRAGIVPDGRVYQRHVEDGRNIAVLLLLDLSQSIARQPEGSDTTLLQVSLEAASLLAWAVETLGDSFAIAGFSSETRHRVRYSRFKDFSDPWTEGAKARLAGMAAGDSTRMGAALRHAARYLGPCPAEKKLLLLLSDGQPHDIDVDDTAYLLGDTHAAVTELKAQGIHTVCITLDPDADAYVADIFGPGGYTVVDQVARLPEKLTRLFMALTRR